MHLFYSFQFAILFPNLVGPTDRRYPVRANGIYAIKYSQLSVLLIQFQLFCILPFYSFNHLVPSDFHRTFFLKVFSLNMMPISSIKPTFDLNRPPWEALEIFGCSDSYPSFRTCTLKILYFLCAIFSRLFVFLESVCDVILV